MRRLFPVLICVCSLAAFTWAQEGKHADDKAGAPATEQHEPSAVWKWANFAMLAIVLGYMMGKALPPFFQARTAEIQKGIAEAAAVKGAAEQRAAEIERRMAALETEVEQIRTESRSEMAKEVDRIEKEADHHLARLQVQAEQEIASMTKHGAKQLKAYAAQLAIDLAEQRIRSRITPAVQSALVTQFVEGVEPGGLGPVEARR